VVLWSEKYGTVFSQIAIRNKKI